MSFTHQNTFTTMQIRTVTSNFKFKSHITITDRIPPFKQKKPTAATLLYVPTLPAHHSKFTFPPPNRFPMQILHNHKHLSIIHT